MNKNLSKRDQSNLDRLTAFIIHNSLHKFSMDYFQKLELSYQLKEYCWKLFGKALTDEELEYCKNRVQIIFCEVLEVLQKYHYACKGK